MTAGGPYVTNIGYLNSTNQDISRMYEPYSPIILNYNCASPNITTSPYYLIQTLPSWTSNNTTIGRTTLSVWNDVTLPTPYEQFCALQATGSFISQDISLQKLKYTLSYYIIGRNQNGSASLFQPANTSITVTINSDSISTGVTANASSWGLKTVSFNASGGLTTLKFLVTVTNGSDSSILITGIVLRVS